jgi:hypothetical protein
MNRTRLYGILILVALLSCVYVLSSAGRFHIVDEVSMYAVTESLALRRGIDTNAIAWTQWVNSPGEVLGAFGADGQVYSKKGPAPSFLAAPWYLFLYLITKANIQIGQLQATLLFNALVTAWTAALLWLTAARLGYGDRTGMLLGLFFGLATIAWPYAKQFFGEPLSAAALLGCFYGMLAWRQVGRWGWLAVAGISAGVALATVTAHALLIGVLALWLVGDWYFRRRPFGARRLLLGLAAFAVPLAITGLLLMAYNAARFGNPFDTGYHFDSGEGFTSPIWQGFWGLIFSPYRGLFWHTPLFFASLVGAVPFVRRHRSEAIAIGAMSAVLILLYSAWWMWWGGFAWGPRFLVPLTPFWVLLIAPLVAQAAPAGTSRRRDYVRWGVYGLAALSFVVQLGAVTMNFVNYEIALRSLYPTDWANPLAFGPPAQSMTAFFDSPVFGQFRLMREDFVGNTDLAWLWADGNVLLLVVIVGGAALITLGGLLLLWWLGDDEGLPGAGFSAPTLILVILLPVIVIAAWVGEVSRDPRYGSIGKGYRGIIADMCTAATPTDVFVNVAPTAYQIPMNWMAGACRDAIPTYGYATDSANHPETVAGLQELLNQHDGIFFVTSGVQPNDPDNTVERWLSANAFKATDTWYDDYRLVQYASPLRLTGDTAEVFNKALLGKQAEQVTIISARAPAVAPAGKPIPVEIVFRLEAPTDQNLRWFVQLLSAENIPLAQLDTGPEDNFTTFASLPPREEQIERAGVLVPTNTPPGEYRLIAGLYNPDAGGARLVTVEGPDFVELGTVRVVPIR